MSLCACTFVFAVLCSRFWDLGGSGLAPNLHLTLHPHTQGKGLSILWRRRPLGSHLHEKLASCLDARQGVKHFVEEAPSWVAPP